MGRAPVRTTAPSEDRDECCEREPSAWRSSAGRRSERRVVEPDDHHGRRARCGTSRSVLLGEQVDCGALAPRLPRRRVPPTAPCPSRAPRRRSSSARSAAGRDSAAMNHFRSRRGPRRAGACALPHRGLAAATDTALGGRVDAPSPPPGDEPVVGKDAVDEPGRERLPGRHSRASEDQLERPRRPTVRASRCVPRSRHHAERHLK